MLSRVKICALLALAGALTAVGAPLNPELKNTAFQPGSGAPLTTKATVLRPGPAFTWAKATMWSGVKVQKITPAPQVGAPVEINGFTFRKTTEAVAPKPAVQPAGSGR